MITYKWENYYVSYILDLSLIANDSYLFFFDITHQSLIITAKFLSFHFDRYRVP